METFSASARFAKLCTPLNKSPRSSAVLVELIQFAEKQIESKSWCLTPHILVIASASAMRDDASGFSIAKLGFSPTEIT